MMEKIWLTDLSQRRFLETGRKLNIDELTRRGLVQIGRDTLPNICVVAAGDGGMLHTIGLTLKKFPLVLAEKVPFYGIDFGTVGFLMNKLTDANLDDLANGRLEYVETRMLQAWITYQDGSAEIVYAFNDFYMERTGRPQAKIRITINASVVFDPLMTDGVIVCGPPGSTAYNFNIGGPILSLDSQDLLITGIGPSRIHNWSSTGLSGKDTVTLEPQQTDFRPVRLVGDDQEYLGVAKAIVSYSDILVVLAFSVSENYRTRRLGYQFGKQIF